MPKAKTPKNSEAKKVATELDISTLSDAQLREISNEVSKEAQRRIEKARKARDAARSERNDNIREFLLDSLSPPSPKHLQALIDSGVLTLDNGVGRELEDVLQDLCDRSWEFFEEWELELTLTIRDSPV